jgi:putative ABC transport system permease protein
MTPEDARRDAIQRFGGRIGIREQTRDANVIVRVETFLQDLGFAVRTFAKRPAFALGALLTIALGIGANTTMLTVVRSVLLRPLPFPDSDRVCAISYASPRGPFWLQPGLADSTYLDFRDQDRSFEAIATFSSAPGTLSGSGEATRVIAATVTPDFFRVLRVDPIIGSGFAPDQDRPGRNQVVLLAETLWRTRFGADPSVINRTIMLDGTPHRVLGVLPAGFSYPVTSEVWTPLEVKSDPHLSFTRPVIGRLKTGVSREQAAASFSAFTSGLRQASSDERDQVPRVISLKSALVDDTTRPLLIFMGAVAFVLLIACANVANLLLIRTVARRQEIATRLALGAGRGRVVRQLLTESALLSIAGGLAATLVSMFATPLLLQFVPPGTLPRDAEIRIDLWVVAVTLAVALIAGLLLGIVPALQAVRGDVSSALREGASSSTRRSLRFRHVLIVAEMALALMLLVGAGLLVRSFVNLRSIQPGFEPSHVMTMTVDLPETRYGTAPAMNAFHQRLLDSLSSLPDVASAGSVNWLPLGNQSVQGDFTIEGRPAPSWNVTKAAVSDGYFKTMGIQVRKGREFTPQDAREHVVIVNESTARQVWPDSDAIGQRLSVESSPKPSDWLTVIGVVADVKQTGLTRGAPPAVYQPYQQVTRKFWLSRMTYVVRTTGDPNAVAPAMRAALRGVDADQAPHAMTSMEALVADTIAEPQFHTRLFGVFSILALALAAVGVYGVLASSVAERRREIGIRIALGAGRASVAGMIVRRTIGLAATGVLLGTIGGLLLTRVLSTFLFGVTPTDPATFAAAATALVLVALIAGFVPARKATAVDPLISLRAE